MDILQSMDAEGGLGLQGADGLVHTCKPALMLSIR